MRKLTFRRPSPALVISIVALFVAMGGTGYTALRVPRHSVGPKQLKKYSVRTSKIKKKAVTRSRIRNKAIGTSQIGDDAVTGSKVLESSLGTVPSATSAASATTATSATTAGSAPPLAYALVGSAGNVITSNSNSKNITAANVSHPAAGEYCFDLPFQPVTVQATPTIFLNVVNFANASLGAGFATSCPGGSEAAVKLFKHDGSAQDGGFTIWLN